MCESFEHKPEDEAGGAPEINAAQTGAEPVNAEQAASSQTDGTPFAADGTYRMVRPDEARETAETMEGEVLDEPAPDRSWEDANYRAEGASTVPPRYYTPEEPAPKGKKPRAPKDGKGRIGWRVACLCLACALVGGLGGGAIGAAVSSKSSGGDTAAVQTTSTPTTSGRLTTQATSSGTMSASDIYAAACQQVVGITTELTYQNIFGQTSSSAVSGSGFIITSDGYILTNYHVISYAYQGNYTVTVMTYDGTSYTASIVGVDDTNDIAVLKIDATGLTPVEFGDSDNIAVGDTVYAVGNPLGELQFSMTTGHVSALDRTITTDESSVPISMFQIDAAVNSGNSGGPVYNDAGQVVGIVTAKYSDTGVEGLGFAIPINDAVSIANELMESGTVQTRVQLGITTKTIPADVAQYYNMVEGAGVLSVNEGSCAETAGLKVNDIITAIDSTEVSTSDALKAALRKYSPGDEATLTVYRSGETITLTVTLDEADESTASENTTTQQQTQQQQQSVYPYSYGYGGY